MTEFYAILNKLTTVVDGGWRITFDVSESDSEAMLELAKRRSQLFTIQITPASNHFKMSEDNNLEGED